METIKIAHDYSPPPSPLSIDEKPIRFTTKKAVAANILLQIPNPKDVDYEPLKMSDPAPPKISLPEGIDYKSPLALFSLFFPDSLLWQIVNNTNM
jgi:hypothetical protein